MRQVQEIRSRPLSTFALNYKKRLENVGCRCGIRETRILQVMEFAFVGTEPNYSRLIFNIHGKNLPKFTLFEKIMNDLETFWKSKREH